MADAPIRWPAEAIWQAVAPLLPEFSVEILPQIDSTNTELMRRARAGRLEPVLLVAERQTAGRGRLGRSWESASPPAPATSVAQTTHGASAVLPALTFSLGLPLAPTDWSGLSLAVGVAVAEALHPDIGLKWPNDLWWHDRKLAGILIETASFGEQRYAVIGVGINIGARLADGLSTAPAWLGQRVPQARAEDALGQVALPLVRAVKAFESLGFEPFQARFNARDVLRDRAVTLSDGTAGTAHGADETGALLVHTARGMQRITSAEISVRPLAQGTP